MPVAVRLLLLKSSALPIHGKMLIELCFIQITVMMAAKNSAQFNSTD
jgi:hypothetical protein